MLQIGQYRDFFQEDRAISFDEAAVERGAGLVSDGSHICIAGSGYGCGDQQFTTEELARNFDIEFSVNLMQRQERALSRYAPLFG